MSVLTIIFTYELLLRTQNIRSRLFYFIPILVIELRRLLSLLLMPWPLMIGFCAVGSYISITQFGVDALVAPVVHFFLLLKSLLFQTLPSLSHAFWIKLTTSITLAEAKIISVLAALLGGWKVWSVKKVVRLFSRFFATLSARFVVFNVLLNLLFGGERKSVKRLPSAFLSRIHNSMIGPTISWWRNAPEKHRRLLSGFVVCLVLVVLGHAMIGFSILVFDLVWELILWAAKLLARVWRFILPMLLRALPNTAVNYITNSLLPRLAEIVPVVRDDQRIMYLRLSFRRNIRILKYHIYRYSRKRRLGIRSALRPMIPHSVRVRKNEMIDKLNRRSKAKKPDIKSEN